MGTFYPDACVDIRKKYKWIACEFHEPESIFLIVPSLFETFIRNNESSCKSHSNWLLERGL